MLFSLAARELERVSDWDSSELMARGQKTVVDT